MGVPMPDMEPVENASAEALLDSLKTIDPGERRKHASVFNYWQSIRGNRPFPPIRDLDPLEISDAGPWSLLLEMIGGGEDAVVRHFGQEIRGGIEVEKIGEAPNPSLLASIHAKLPIVAACREAFAFEETFDTGDGARRCWVTLLPFSQTGSWIDFVYGYVSLEGAKDFAEAPAENIAEAVADAPAAADEVSEIVEDLPEPEDVADEPAEEDSQELFPVGLKPSAEAQETAEATTPIVPMVSEPEPEPAAQLEPELPAEAQPIEEVTDAEASVEVEADREPQPRPDEEAELDAQSKPRFSAKFLEGLASSFYGKVSQSTPTVSGGPFEEEPVDSLADEPTETAPDEPAEPVTQPASIREGVLQSKLSEVRTLAAEAREAQVRSNIALYEGLSAAYDFALDAESEPEEYLRLVEAQGLKIQLRSPMKPVVKLAFDGMCDEPTIKQLEAVLAWALKQDLPRGTLADRIQEEGGIGQILNGKAAA